MLLLLLLLHALVEPLELEPEIPLPVSSEDALVPSASESLSLHAPLVSELGDLLLAVVRLPRELVHSTLLLAVLLLSVLYPPLVQLLFALLVRGLPPARFTGAAGCFCMNKPMP